MNSDRTREVVSKWYEYLSQGNLEGAINSFSEDVEWDIPATKYNEIVPWVGKMVGREQILEAFKLRDAAITLKAFEMRDLLVENDRAIAFVYEHSICNRTQKSFELEIVQLFTVRDGQISSWKAYYDACPIIDAFSSDIDSLLVESVRNEDADSIRRVLKYGANPNARENTVGLTVLMMAACQANLEIVSILLDAGADVFAMDRKTGATALHKACQGGSLDIVKLLLDAGAFIDAVTPTMGHTPIMDALWYKWVDIVKLLVERGANLNLSTHYGFSIDDHLAFELNVNQGDEKQKFVVIKELIEAGREDALREAGSQAIMNATKEADPKGVNELIEKGDDVNTVHPRINSFDDGYTPLLVAARDGHADIVKKLLDAGAKVRVEDWIFKGAPIHKATYNGNLGILKMLVNHPDIDIDVQGPINGYTPLHDALWHGFSECAEILIDAGANLNLRGHDGKAPLALAREVLGEGHEITKLILSKQN